MEKWRPIRVGTWFLLVMNFLTTWLSEKLYELELSHIRKRISTVRFDFGHSQSESAQQLLSIRNHR